MPTYFDLQFLLDIEDIDLGGMDGVEDERDDQRQEKGHPASDQKVSDGGEWNFLVTDLQLLATPQKSQKSQAKRGIILMLFNQLVSAMFSHKLEAKDDEDIETLLYKLGVVLVFVLVIVAKTDLIVTK